MLLVSLLLPAAHADMALIACETVTVSATIPAAASVDVPVDVLPRVLFRGECEPPSAHDISLVRLVDGEEQEVAFETAPWNFDAPSHMVSLDAGELEPDSDYLLRVMPVDGWGELTEVGFSTGSGRVEPLADAPEVALTWAGYEEAGEQWAAWFEAEMTPVADPSGLSTIHLVLDDPSELVLASEAVADGGDMMWAYPRLITDEEPEQICVRAMQMDGAGRTGAVSEPACIEPDYEGRTLTKRVFGCDTTGGVASLYGLVLAAGALARRRRRA